MEISGGLTVRPKSSGGAHPAGAGKIPASLKWLVLRIIFFTIEDFTVIEQA